MKCDRRVYKGIQGYTRHLIGPSHHERCEAVTSVDRPGLRRSAREAFQAPRCESRGFDPFASRTEMNRDEQSGDFSD